MCQHPKRTFNPNFQLRVVDIVRIFCSTGNSGVRGCHVWGVQICIVAKDTLAWSQYALFQLLKQWHTFEG